MERQQSPCENCHTSSVPSTTNVWLRDSVVDVFSLGIVMVLGRIAFACILVVIQLFSFCH